MERRGQVNQYEPYPPDAETKLKPVFTINLADGVTPFMKLFHGKEFSSQCYRLSAVRCVVTHGWYRPQADYFGYLDEHTQDHVLNGGLCLADLDAAIRFQLPDDPVREDWSYEKFQHWCLSYYGRRRPPLEQPRGGPPRPPSPSGPAVR